MTARIVPTSGRSRSIHDEPILRVARLLELRYPEHERHGDRVGALSHVLASRAGLSADHSQLVRVGAITRDIGTIGVPDVILVKPGPLDSAEWEIVRRHPEIGHGILAGPAGDPFTTAAVVALTHHERWDGTGYPRGLHGTEAPVEGRIVAVADAFDALTSERPYRNAFAPNRAAEILASERGRQFDPDLVDLFISRGIMESFA